MNDMDDEAVEKVLQRQHAELITRMEGWFKHLEAVLEAKDHSSRAPRAPRAPEWNRFDGDPEAIGLQSKDLALEALELSSVLEDSCDLSVANEETHRAKETFGHAEALQGGSSMDHMQTTMQNRLRRTESQLSYQKARTLGDRIESFKREQTESLSMHRKRSAISLWWEATVRVRAQYVAEALPFNVFFAFVILSNSLFLGLQLEMKASGETPASLTVVNVIYAILFTGEMTIRIMAMGLSTYLFGKGAGWNWLDVLVVVPAWVELALDLWTDEQGMEGGSSSTFRIIRIFKITRLLQVVRSLRIVKFISALRALVMSVVDTTRQLLWALILLGLVQYSFGILFTDAVLDYLASNGPDADQMKYFGTVFTSVMTLFRSILGGLDWEYAADALIPVGWFWVQIFHLYIAFCGFAVLNVMTGVFVNSAIKTRERDHETLIQNKNRFKELVSKIWSKMDADGHGQITITEFERMFEDESMKAFFSAIELNAVDAWTLFDVLDVDGDHTINIDEFMERCMQLHGPARSVDLYSLKKGIRSLEGIQREIMKHIQNGRLPASMGNTPEVFDRENIDRWSI